MRPQVAAFDDCEATALPRNEAEWLKFDAVILGDVSPEQLGPDGVQALETFVRKKGGSLVVIAGPNFMPHAYRSSPLADLLPVKLTGPGFQTAKSPDSMYFLRSTLEGQAHVILQQTDGRPASALQHFPELSWRHPDCEARVGATVLAYASLQPKIDLGDDNKDRAAPEEPSQEAQRRAALMAWHRFGAGKVLQLNFDESWRLRYGIGDRLHHQFWGQIIRWSVNERLSIGTDLVRMGTDRNVYHSGDPIIVQARLLDEQRNPITDQPVKAVLLQDNVPVANRRSDSSTRSSRTSAGGISRLRGAGKVPGANPGRNGDPSSEHRCTAGGGYQPGDCNRVRDTQ
ncbi:MAG UNVERIFIED_CONTAM: hypothetical protein LVR18_00955 [Planctomycetaceae bacterium]|jgi:hypothetical protein